MYYLDNPNCRKTRQGPNKSPTTTTTEITIIQTRTKYGKKNTLKSQELQTEGKPRERLKYKREEEKGQVRHIRPIRDNQGRRRQEQELHVWRLEWNTRAEEVADLQSSIWFHWFYKQSLCRAGTSPRSLNNELCMANHGVLSTREWPHQRVGLTLRDTPQPFLLEQLIAATQKNWPNLAWAADKEKKKFHGFGKF